MTDILPRLLRACATGYGCRSMISPKGLGSLTRHKLWREAAEAIIRLDAVHPRSQDRFLEVWVQPWAQASFTHDLDEDLAVAFLRKVMPPYPGYDTLLFRGQVRGPVGMSWTPLPHIALAYALYGLENPLEAKECRTDTVILRSIIPAGNIISLHPPGGEYIIDPRGFEFSTEPALEAAVWICERTADRRRRMGFV